MPSRYLATVVSLLLPYLTSPAVGPTGQPGPSSRFALDLMLFLRWQLSEGLVVWQVLGFTAFGLVGSTAWCKGSFRSAIKGWLAVLRAEGGTLAGMVLLIGLLCAFASSLCYFLVLSIPTQTWVLMSADAYSHFATLPLGLFLTAGLVELGRRSLPLATKGEPVAPIESAHVGMINTSTHETFVAH